MKNIILCQLKLLVTLCEYTLKRGQGPRDYYAELSGLILCHPQKENSHQTHNTQGAWLTQSSPPLGRIFILRWSSCNVLLTGLICIALSYIQIGLVAKLSLKRNKAED